MPHANTVYLSILFGLKRGFEKHNVEVFASVSHYDETCLLTFCHQFKPDLIFELNRSRSQLPNLPKHIVHIAWILDLLGHDIDYYHGSDITYLFSNMWKRNFTANGGLVDSMQPGTCEISYDFQPTQAISDFSFVGHIPKPWTEEELSREIFQHQGQAINFGRLHDELLNYWNDISFKENMTHINSAYQMIDEHYRQKIDIKDQWLRYDLGCRIIRLRNRHQLISLVLKTSDSLRIYGSENWKDWPQYQPHYYHFVDNSHDLKQIYQSTKLNLHEGISPRFRVFDAMSSGGLVFVKRTPEDHAEGGMCDFFEPFVHYVPFSDDDFAELADKYLCDDTARQKIIVAAADQVHTHHTWSHRAEKIIQDYYRVI